MNINPLVSLLVDGKRLSVRQLEALVEISNSCSQTQAARILGISAPVLHRYIKRGELDLGFPLIKTNPTGSVLTPEGIKIVKAYKKYLKATLPVHQNLSVGCSVITQKLLHNSLLPLEEDGMLFELYIGDDDTNRRLLELGELDMVVFDDPLNAYEYEGDAEYQDIAFDTLYHIYRGRSYNKYRYGAQRIGFKHLQLNNSEYILENTISDLTPLLDAKRSFFINQSLVRRMDLTIESDIPHQLFNHAIIAMMVRESTELHMLVKEMKKRAKNFGFIT
ncbi:MAG: LysR family transcriptional regulator [Halobacteriota archaeon]|nr:LysR family transcriptional regulator [Halobacteriota archaeon]